MNVTDLVLIAALAAFCFAPKWVPQVSRYLPAGWHRLSYTVRTRIVTTVCIVAFVLFAVYGPWSGASDCDDCYRR